MNQTQRNIIAIAGVFSTVFGILAAIPSFLKESYGMATGGTLLMVAGLVLIAIAFGD